MNDEIKYGRSPLEVAHFILIGLGIVFGGIGIVLVSPGWWVFGAVVVLLGLAFFGANQALSE
jgi:hypothetical protein